LVPVKNVGARPKAGERASGGFPFESKQNKVVMSDRITLRLNGFVTYEPIIIGKLTPALMVSCSVQAHNLFTV